MNTSINNTHRLLGLVLGALSTLSLTACLPIDQSEKMRVLVMPSDKADAWVTERFDSRLDPKLELEFAAGTSLVAGVNVSCLLEDEVETFDCKTTVDGNHVFVDIDLKSDDGTDDCPGGFRRLCPIGELPAGTYTVHALDDEMTLEVPGVALVGDLYLPKLPKQEEQSE